MRIVRLLFLLLLPLLATGCGNTPHARLRAADALMESAPDSALATLQNVDLGALSSADSAYYALLYTQAQIKTNTYLTSDSLISRALAAYRFSPDPSLRLRSHFYSAQVAYRCRNYREAMKNAVVAYDVATESQDPYWIAKSAELLGDLYTIVYNSEQAGRYTKLSADAYLKADRIRNHRFSLCDLASNYKCRELYDSAYELIDSIIGIAKTETPLDSSLLHYAQRVLIGIQLATEEYADMCESVNEFNYTPSDNQAGLSYSTIKTYAASNQGDSVAFMKYIADAFLLAENERDSLPVVYSLYCDALASNNYENAVILSDSLMRMQSRVTNALLDESFAAIQSDYYASQNELKRQKNASLQRLIIVIIVSSALTIILLIIIYSLRLKTAKATIQANIASIQVIKARSHNNEQLIESLLKDKWSIVNKLCNIYYDKNESDLMLKHAVREIESELNEFRTPESIRDILAATDGLSDGAITLLRTECSFLKEQEIEFLGLILAGLSVRAVCYIAGIKKDYYYKKKNRLMQRVANSNAPHKELLLSKLSQFVS